MNEKELENEFKFNIVEQIGVISENFKGWTKEVNLISYNSKKEVIDIRLWSPNKKMSKGITIAKEDKEKLIELLQKIN